MFKFTLTDEEALLMKRVCELQLESLNRILQSNPEEELQQKLKENSVSERELKKMITEVTQQYKDVYVDPENLFKLHSDLLTNFREALDYNTSMLADFSQLIPPMLNKLDLAIHIVRHQN